MTVIDEPMTLRVLDVQALSPVIKQLRLAALEPSARLPSYAPGAHISVEVQPEAGGASQWRRYSLVSFSATAGDRQSPAEYLIAVRRDDRGRGGSKFVHESLEPGDRLRVLPPRNDFQLSTAPVPVLLVAGGIGITPLATMAAELCGRDRPVTLFYAGRNRESLAYVEPLRSLLGDGLRLHVDDEAGAPPDLGAVIAAAPADAHVYVCGPQPMLDAILASARSAGWAPERIHFEMFGPPTGAMPDRSFEVLLSRSGRRLSIGPGQTLLQALHEAGCDVLYDCERGECGVCRIEVLEGCVDHRDYVLTERERAEGRCMHPCVSRSMGDRLVLDL